MLVSLIMKKILAAIIAAKGIVIIQMAIISKVTIDSLL